MLYIELILYFLLIITPIILVRRFNAAVKNSALIGFFLNPILYLISFSYLYLIVGSVLLINGGYEFYFFSINNETMINSNLLVIYTFTIFLFTYLFSKNYQYIVAKNKIAKNNLIFLISISIAIFLIIAIITGIYAPTLRSMRANRSEVFSFFVSNIMVPYKIDQLLNYALVIFLILGVLTRSKIIFLLSFLPLLALLYLEFLQGGRAISIKIFIAITIIYVIRNNSINIKLLLFLSLFLVLVGLFQRFDVSNLSVILLGGLGEFALTRITTDLIISKGLSGDLVTHMVNSVMFIFPGKISSIFIEKEIPLAEILVEKLNMSYGLASNLTSESFFYGGYYFGIISPLIVATTYYLINKLKLIKRFIGFIFVIFVIIFTQNMLRSSFYSLIPTIIYCIFSYFIIFVILFRKKNILIESPAIAK